MLLQVHLYTCRLFLQWGIARVSVPVRGVQAPYRVCIVRLGRQKKIGTGGGKMHVRNAGSVGQQCLH